MLSTGREPEVPVAGFVKRLQHGNRPLEPTAYNHAMIERLPRWSRSTLEKLVDRGDVSTAEPHPIGGDEAGQLRTMAWIVDTYIRYDENPAIDHAMNEPGRVLLEKSELHYEQGTYHTNAAMLGQDKQGRPVAFVMHRDDGELEGYSVQNLGDALYVQGGLVTPGGDGFYRSGAVDGPSEPKSD